MLRLINENNIGTIITLAALVIIAYQAVFGSVGYTEEEGKEIIACLNALSVENREILSKYCYPEKD